MAPPSDADRSPSEPEIQDADALRIQTLSDDGSRSEPETQDADARWIQTLSEPELDLMISLKELAVMQSAQFDLSQRFHLRTLHALAVVLLEHSKDRLKQNLVELDTLALLRDPEESSSNNGLLLLEHSKDQLKQNSVELDRHALLRDPEESSSNNELLLLEHSKDQLKQNSVELNRHALLSDPDESSSNIGKSSEVPGSSQVHSTSNGVNKKRKELQHVSNMTTTKKMLV